MDAETVGFKVAVEGTTATVVLKEPYETARTPHSARFAARFVRVIPVIAPYRVEVGVP